MRVTPAGIRGAPVLAAERDAILATWARAIDLANDFLASDFRRTLPEGRYTLDEASGMTFHATDADWPIAVRCTTWGDVCTTSGFAAQERSWGFVVGQRAPRRDRRTDNSLFRDAMGNLLPASVVAELVLHETTHTVHHEGTVGFWQGVAYYLEAIFLFRYAGHSAERHANGTSEEFRFFFRGRAGSDEDRARLRAVLDAHQAEADRKACLHGLPDTG